jgi:hypothetical protein
MCRAAGVADPSVSGSVLALQHTPVGIQIERIEHVGLDVVDIEHREASLRIHGNVLT